MKVTILIEDEIRMCTGMDQEAVNAVALGFTRLVEGKVSLHRESGGVDVAALKTCLSKVDECLHVEHWTDICEEEDIEPDGFVDGQ